MSRLLAHGASALAWSLIVFALAACSVPATLTPFPTPSVGPTILPSPIPLSRAFPSPNPTVQPSNSTPTPIATPTNEPSAHYFDTVDSQALLLSLFPDLKLTPNGDEYVVNGDPDWLMWIESTAEGEFTQDAVPELAVIVANEAPHVSDADRQQTALWGSFLVIFRREGIRLPVVERSSLFATDISPLTFEVKISRVVDYDHDGQNELLIITNATRAGISSSAAFLYQWNDQAFVEIWSAAAGEDNTAAINQTQYYASTSDFQFDDLNGDGLDEIVLTTTRIDYAQDDQGLADIDREIGRHVERKVYSWSGAAFVLDSALSSSP